MTLGERLKKAREDKGFTQSEVALELDIDASTVSAWEREKAEPSIQTLLRLALLYNVDVINLISDEEKAVLGSDLLSALKKATPEQKERIIDYLEGKVNAPVDYSHTEMQFMEDARHLTVEDLMHRYSLKIGERNATPEEVREAIDYIKARRIMRMMQE